jgi:predicted ATP-grasp superfamily ATP-dependent carboligase
VTRYGIEVMFQEIIPGPPRNSYQLEGYYNMDHSPTVLFARQRLRIWPPDFGNTTLCVSIPLSKLAKEKGIVNEFMRTIGYHGLMSAEFKEDERDGTLKFLEINARAWMHFWLSARCGADIIFSSYLDAIGEKTEYVEEYETGVKSIYLLADLGASMKMFLDRDLGFSDWISSLSGDVEDALFQRKDLSPFMMHCAIKVRSYLNNWF